MQSARASAADSQNDEKDIFSVGLGAPSNVSSEAYRKQHEITVSVSKYKSVKYHRSKPLVSSFSCYYTMSALLYGNHLLLQVPVGVGPIFLPAN